MPKIDAALQKRVGGQIRTAREQASLRQEDVADQLNVKRTTITSWEMGMSMPHITQLPKLAGILHVPIQYFFDADESDDVA